MFHKWKKYLGESIEVIPIELSGRGRRYREPLYDSFDNMVDDVYSIVTEDIDETPYAFFGYSMGSWIAYDLSYKLIEAGYKEPEHIFFSARRPPYVKKKDIIYHTLSEDKMREEIIKLGGISRELIENKQFMNMFMPIIRSDFKNVNEYEYKNRGFKLLGNVTVFYGIYDDMTFEDVQKWRDSTNGNLDFYAYEGGHFFILDNLDSILDTIGRKLVNNF